MLLGKSAEYKGIRCFWSDFLPFEQPRANLSIYDFISFLSLKCRDKNWLSTSPHGHTGNVKRQDRANKKKVKIQNGTITMIVTMKFIYILTL